MADMTPTPWPGPDDKKNQTDRFWPNGSYAAWAFDDGSWAVFRPVGDPTYIQLGLDYAGSDESPEAVDCSPALLLAARAAADEALARLLAEMAAEVANG